MAKTEVVRARIEPELKRNVEQLLEQLGLSTTEAIRLFFRQMELRRGLPFPVELPNAETLATFEKTDRGEEVCRTVYGGQYEGLRRNVRDLHPDMERWMVVEGYGKVLGRPGLDPQRRRCSDKNGGRRPGRLGRDRDGWTRVFETARRLWRTNRIR